MRRLLSEILKNLTKYPAVGLIGPRQVGKTTLVKSLLDQQSVYLDLQSDRDLSKLQDPGIFFRRHAHERIILDEIQEKPELFPLLRSIIDEDRRPGRFVILGSASPSIIRNSSESLAGRISYLELTPLLASETLLPIERHWIKGGFPESVLEEDDELSLSWRKQLIRTYIERDLPILGLDANKRVLTNFLRMLAGGNGNVWNASLFAKSLGMTSPTVKRYVDFLEGAFLVYILEPYATNVKKRIVKSPKVYFRDTGLLHALLDIQSMSDLEGNLALGNSWENYVIQQVIGQFGDRFSYYFYRTPDGTEMDLVLVRKGKPVIGIEAKFSHAPKITRGFVNAMTDLKTSQNFLVNPSSERYPVHENAEVIGISELLKLDL